MDRKYRSKKPIFTLSRRALCWCVRSFGTWNLEAGAITTKKENERCDPRRLNNSEKTKRPARFGLTKVQISSESGNTVHPYVCVKRNYFNFRWTMRNWSLFLAHIGTNVWLQKCTRFRPMLISSLLRHQQSQNLETVPVCIVQQYYPHDNIVCIHKYNEFLKSIDSGVCYRPWSIS